MTFDETVILIEEIETEEEDDYGNTKCKKVKSEVFCNEKSISRNEFYSASVQDLKLSYILTIHDFEYENQDKVIYKGKELYILKTYKTGEYLELTVGDKIG